jgi:hypothetical protein
LTAATVGRGVDLGVVAGFLSPAVAAWARSHRFGFSVPAGWAGALRSVSACRRRSWRSLGWRCSAYTAPSPGHGLTVGEAAVFGRFRAGPLLRRGRSASCGRLGRRGGRWTCVCPARSLPWAGPAIPACAPDRHGRRSERRRALRSGARSPWASGFAGWRAETNHPCSLWRYHHRLRRPADDGPCRRFLRGDWAGRRRSAPGIDGTVRRRQPRQRAGGKPRSNIVLPAGTLPGKTLAPDSLLSPRSRSPPHYSPRRR